MNQPTYRLAVGHHGDLLLEDSRHQPFSTKTAFTRLRDFQEIAFTRDRVAKVIRYLPAGPELERAVAQYESWRGKVMRVRHKQFLARKRLHYVGATLESGARQDRSNHCYSCHATVDGRVHAICSGCSYLNIICPRCGACGCAFRLEIALDREYEWAADDVENWFLYERGEVVHPESALAKTLSRVSEAGLARRHMYRLFLQTPRWREIRTEALALGGHKCNRCADILGPLHVHHKTYERVGGRERMADLEVLCEACHYKEHGFADKYAEFVSGNLPDVEPAAL
jgi:hypothetical protein